MNLAKAIILLSHLCDDESSDSDSYSAIDSIHEEDYLNTDSDSSLDLGPVSKLSKVQDYVEDTVHSYSDIEFKNVFRIERKTFKYIIGLIDEDEILFKRNIGRKRISAEQALLMTLYFFSKDCRFQEVSNRFNVTISTAHRMISTIVNYLDENSKIHIAWPENEEKIITITELQKITELSSVIGVISNCHINIKKPNDDSNLYLSNDKHSILLQVVCDSKKKIIDTFCGETGTLNSKQLLFRSTLNKRTPSGTFDKNFLIGDLSYYNLDWVITEFKDNNKLSVDEIDFNNKVIKGTEIIENTIKELKGRFPHFNFFRSGNIDFIVRCVTSIIVLHNICIKQGDIYDFDVIDHINDTFSND